MFPHYSRSLLLHHLTLHHSLEATIDALLQLPPEEVMMTDSSAFETTASLDMSAPQAMQPQDTSMRQRALQAINRRWSATASTPSERDM